MMNENNKRTFFDEDTEIHSSNHHPITTTRRRTVRFNRRVAVHHNKKRRADVETTTPSTTWLTLDDYGSIQNSIFNTLDRIMIHQGMNQHHQRYRRQCFQNNQNNYNGSFHSRGLEDYCPRNKGLLKDRVLIRRKEAVYAVLEEQEKQRRRQQQKQNQFFQQQQNQEEEESQQLRSQDENMIRRVYQYHTLCNANDAVARGAYDSEEALAVYAELQNQLNCRDDDDQRMDRCFHTSNDELRAVTPPVTSAKNKIIDMTTSPVAVM